MEPIAQDRVPGDKFIVLIDNRNDQRLMKINDNKYSDNYSEILGGGKFR